MENTSKRSPSKIYAIKSFNKAVKKLEELKLVEYSQLQELKTMAKTITTNYMETN